MGSFEFHEGEKFGVLAIEGVYSTIPEDAAVQLSDGTRVHTHLPLEIGSHWREWIGTLRLERLRNSNAILFHSESSTNPQILDGQHQQLGTHLSVIFYTLQLSGVLEYGGASLLLGSLCDGDSQVRQMSELEFFKHTKGYTRTPLTTDRLEQTARFRHVLADLESPPRSFERVLRGFNVLMDGLKQTYARDRIHQFVRSLEVLILPNPDRPRDSLCIAAKLLQRLAPLLRQSWKKPLICVAPLSTFTPGITLYGRTRQTKGRMLPYKEPGNWRHRRVSRTLGFLRIVRSENISGMKQHKATSGGRWTMPPEERHGASNSTSRA